MESFSRREFASLLGAALACQGIAPQASGRGIAWPFRASYGPFHCASEVPLQGVETLFGELGALQRELTRTLAIPAATAPIEVLLFATEHSHRRHLQQAFPRVPYRRALYVQRSGQGVVYAYLHPEVTVDLRHECTHALLHAQLPMVPLWLDEGLAEYFEVAHDDRAFGHPHLGRLRWDLRLLGMVRPLEALERQHELTDMGAAEYRFAWAWVHFMLHGPEAAHSQLVGYLADIRRGSPPGVLSERLRKVLPDLDHRMQLHFKYWRV